MSRVPAVLMGDTTVDTDGVTLRGVNTDVPNVARIYDYLALSHATAGNLSSGNLAQAVQTYTTTSAGSITPRSPEQIEAFFEGLRLEEPGVVPVAHWGQESGGPPPATYGPTFLGGLGRKTAIPR